MKRPDFMALALAEAEAAAARGEVPIGAVIAAGGDGRRQRRQPHPRTCRSDRACRDAGDPRGLRRSFRPSGSAAPISM